VLRGDAGVPEREALGEAGSFDEPGGGELDSASRADAGCGPVRNLGGIERETAGEIVELPGEDDWILEEGAGAAGIGVTGNEEHALCAADLADGVVNLERRGLLAGEVLGEVGVGEVRPRFGREAKGDSGDDVAFPGLGVEEAGAVGKAAGLVGELGEGAGLEVEGADGEDGLGDLLTVSADVLDG